MFFYYFCLMIEGFVSLTNGSESGSSKHIRISNTGFQKAFKQFNKFSAGSVHDLISIGQGLQAA
jgi:hypothetical protein